MNLTRVVLLNSIFYALNALLKPFDKFITLDSALFLRNLLIAFLIDGLLFDDEPVWEPLEWSLLQTWVLFMYIFSWAAEVLFSSRYGSYTNRDKIVWLGLFKVYYYLVSWFVINMISVTVFITLPFYFEITYAVSYSVVWWNWFTSVFFFKFATILTLTLLLASFLKFNLRWLSLIQFYVLFILIFSLLFWLFIFNAVFLFLSFFTDASEFRSSGWSNLSSITHGPQKWSWGLDSRDHFSYHRTPTVFWFKSDPLIGASLLFLNILIFLFLFFLILQVLSVVRVIYSTKEISYNLVLFFYSTLKQFFYLILSLQAFVFLSYIYQFMRYPFELYWFTKFYFLLQTEVYVLEDLLHAFVF